MRKRVHHTGYFRQPTAGGFSLRWMNLPASEDVAPEPEVPTVIIAGSHEAQRLMRRGGLPPWVVAGEGPYSDCKARVWSVDLDDKPYTRVCIGTFMVHFVGQVSDALATKAAFWVLGNGEADA